MRKQTLLLYSVFLDSGGKAEQMEINGGAYAEGSLW